PHTPPYPPSVLCPLTSSVQTTPPPATVIVVRPVLPSDPTRASSSDPSGGLNASEVTVIAESVTAGAGADGSSWIVPADRISTAPQEYPPFADGASEPTAVAPGVPVTEVVWNVPYLLSLTVSWWLSIRVVPAWAVSVVPTAGNPISAPYTIVPAAVVVTVHCAGPVAVEAN